MKNWFYGTQAKPIPVATQGTLKTSTNIEPLKQIPPQPIKPVYQDSTPASNLQKIIQDTSGSSSERSVSSGQRTSYTTGEGDGLVLNPDQMNIYEMIQAIKDRGNLSTSEDQDSDSDVTSSQPNLEQTNSRSSIYDINMDEIACENLKPISYLIEAVKSLDQLRSEFKSQKQLEDEFLNVLKSAQFGITKVYSCSQSLDLLLTSYRQQFDQNQSLVERVNELEKENFEQKIELTEQLSVNKYLRKQSQASKERLSTLTVEHKRLSQRVLYLEGTQHELNQMQFEERMRMMYDCQMLREKIDSKQLQLQRLTRELSELREFKDNHDMQIREEQERFDAELSENVRLKKEYEASRRTFTGIAKTDQITMVMHNLDTNDQLKLLLLSQTIRRQLAPLFHSPLSQNLCMLVSQQQSADRQIQELRKQVRTFEIKSLARTQLLQNVNDQRLREIITKHVIASTTGQSFRFELNEVIRNSYSFLQLYSSCLKPEQETQVKWSLGGIGGYLLGAKKMDSDQQIVTEEVKSNEVDISGIESAEQLSDLLYKISTQLVADKQKLPKWISGVQQGFSILLMASQKLQTEYKELELLKEFFASRIETLKLRLEELLNEKEDLVAVQQSDLSIKEHLMKKFQDLENNYVRMQADFLFKSKRCAELEHIERDVEGQIRMAEDALRECQTISKAKVQTYKTKNKRLSNQNKSFRVALNEMTTFFDQIQ